MKYFVTNISNIQYTSKEITIKPKTEVELAKEIYDYLNATFGDSGKFTFRTDGKKASTKNKKPEVETVEVEEVKELTLDAPTKTPRKKTKTK